MSDKLYIRVKSDGFIYDWNPIMAASPECEEITEQEAFPDRFMTASAAKKIADLNKPKRGRGPRKGLDLATDIPEEPVYTDPELAAEASRGWPE